MLSFLTALLCFFDGTFDRGIYCRETVNLIDASLFLNNH